MRTYTLHLIHLKSVNMHMYLKALATLLKRVKTHDCVLS